MKKTTKPNPQNVQAKDRLVLRREVVREIASSRLLEHVAGGSCCRGMVTREKEL
ncbi:MAG TPA: hypothetical protein VLX92_12905 [Kofleriaceae bacterium]|nr:hypothetical protein [Kofleriaceae bacterium]